MRQPLKIASCFALLLLWPYLVSANSLKWVPKDDREAVDLSVPLKTLDGEEVSLADFGDKVLFLNFWATWCGPCRKEMPDMERMQERLRQENVAVIAVSDDRAEDIEAYLDSSPYPFKFLIDSESALSLLMGVPGLPTTVILDRERRIALAHVGVYDWDDPEVVEALRRLSKE